MRVTLAAINADRLDAVDFDRAFIRLQDAEDGFQEIPDKDDHLIISRNAPGTRLLTKDKGDEVHQP